MDSSTFSYIWAMPNAAQAAYSVDNPEVALTPGLEALNSAAAGVPADFAVERRLGPCASCRTGDRAFGLGRRWG